MSEEHGPARGRVEEEWGERVHRGRRRDQSEKARELRILTGWGGQRNEDVCEEVNEKREEEWGVKEPENQARGEQHSLCPYRVPGTFLKMKRERCSINKRII